ncbi:MAG: hypothetical protein EBS07_00180 [Sphingobacteriia bacterium]|nr:hypothetical protein [Sphingobacteriia bacterium]
METPTAIRAEIKIITLGLITWKSIFLNLVFTLFCMVFSNNRDDCKCQNFHIMKLINIRFTKS